MLLKQKVVLISREVIERARQRDEQTEVLTEVRTRFQGPQYVLPLTMALLTSLPYLTTCKSTLFFSVTASRRSVDGLCSCVHTSV